MSSRKRKYSPAANVLAVYRPPTYKKRRVSAPPFRPGRDRVGGYYGRYSGKNSELKFHDILVVDAVVATGGVIQNAGTINIIPQGVTEVQRIGRKCTLRSIHMTYQVTIPRAIDQATPPLSDTLRIILYQDKQCNGATATSAGILEANDIFSYRNLANSGRFLIHLDKMVDMNYMTLTSTQNADTFEVTEVEKTFRWNKSCTIPLEFDADTGALTEIRSNNLGVLLISSNGTVGFNARVRLRFSDQG